MISEDSYMIGTHLMVYHDVHDDEYSSAVLLFQDAYSIFVGK
jgi:hypothetical protein